MTYATIDDIEAELKGINFTTTSQVTSTAVNNFLLQTDALINSYIYERYELPITGVESLEILKKIEIDFVVWRVSKILDLTKSEPIPAGGVPQEITEGSAYRESMALLASIKANKNDLPDATEINPTSPLASFHSDPNNLNITPFFDMESQQW